MKKLLLVDDDTSYAKEFAGFFSPACEITTLHNEKDFYERFTPYAFDLVVLDIRLNGKTEGLDILRFIKGENPFLPVVMITAYDSTDYYTQAISLGADAYLGKNKFDLGAIRKVFDTILEKSSLERQVSHLKQRIDTLEARDIISKSEKMEAVKEKIKMAAMDGKMTVLIRGETGVGKELVARNIHRLGVRRKGPFFTVMIAGIPGDIVYSELFGHERGAFTGAQNKRRGYIEESHKGVLFLDEIGDLDPDAQVKLLRVLEYQTFSRLGSSKEIEVDVQFVAAANKDLEKLAAEKKLREDLYFRLKAFEIVVPPLRERKEDIPVLCDFFLSQMLQTGRTSANKITTPVMDILLAYHWPGNVRELKNIIESLCTYAKFKNKTQVDEELLPHIDGVVTKKSQLLPSPGGIVQNYEKHLATAELQLIENAIPVMGKTKTVLAEKLGYNDRFTLLRRVKRCFERFPELKEDFPAAAALFSNG